MDIRQSRRLNIFRRPFARRTDTVMATGGFKLAQTHQAHTQTRLRHRFGRSGCIRNNRTARWGFTFLRRQTARRACTGLASGSGAPRQTKTRRTCHNGWHRTPQNIADFLRCFVLHPKFAQHAVLFLPAGAGWRRGSIGRRCNRGGCAVVGIIGHTLKRTFQRSSPT